MENKGNKLSEVLNRMNSLVNLVNYMNEHEPDFGMLDRDLVLQQIREIYAMVIELPASPVTAETELPVPEVEEPVVAEPVEAEEQVVEEAPVVEMPVVEEAPMAEEPVVEEEPKEEEPVFAPAEPEPEVEPAPAPVMEEIEGAPFENVFEEPVAKPVADVVVEAEPVAEPVPEPEPEPVPEPVAEPEPVKEERQVKHKKAERPTEQPSLFDFLNSSTSAPSQFEKPASHTLADKIGGGVPTVEDQLEQKVHANKVSDLRTVININDKFSFVNELFHNNMKGYTDFILRLNAITSREEALAVTAEMAALHKWAEDSLAVRTFYKILDRKF